MRKIKIILYSLLGILAVFTSLLAFILGTYSQQDYQRLLISSVDRFSDYRLSISGSFNFNPSLHPSLSTSGVTLQSKINDNRIRVDRFKIHIAIRPLFSGTLLIRDLLVENMEMHFTARKEEERDYWLLNFLPFPVIEHALFTNVRVLTRDQKSHALSSFLIQAAAKDQPIKIQGTGQYRNRPFTIQGQLGLLSDINKNDRPFPVVINVKWAQSILSMHGTIKNPSHGKGMELDVNFNSPAISTFLDSEIPVEGRLAANGRITGEYDEPALTGFRAELNHKSDLKIEVAGTVGNLLTYENTALHLSGYINEHKFMKRMLPEKSPSFNQLDIEADLREDGHAFMLENTAINLSAPEGLDVQLNGRTRVIFDRQPFRSMDIQAAFTSLHTETVKQYLGNILPEMGTVKGTAHITTQGRNFVLTNIDLLAGHGQKTQLTAKGHVGPLPFEPNSNARKISLDLALNAEKSSGLASLFDIDYPEIGPVKINARLSGSAQEIGLEEIQLEAGFSEILSIHAGGEMKWRKLDSDHPVQYTDFKLRASTPSFRNAFRLYGKNMPDLGSTRASMRVHGTGMVLAGSDLKIRVGSADSLLISAQGKVEQIYLENLYHKGIELSAEIEGPSTSSLAGLFEDSKIPDFGPFNGFFYLQGDSETLSASKVNLKAGRRNGLMLNATGRIDEIPLKEAPLPRGVRIQLEASAPSTADLSPLTEQKTPDLGPIKVNGLLVDQKGFFAVHDLLILAGNPKRPFITAKGSIEDLFSQNGIKINILFDEKTLIKLFDLHAVPELGRLNGNILLSGAGGNLGIEEIKIESDHSELIDLKIKGTVEDLLKANEINMNVEFSIADMALFGKLFDTELPDLGVVKGVGQLHGTGQLIAFKGQVIVNKTTLDSDISVSFADSVPLISGKIRSPNIYLEDFGIHPEESEKEPKKITGPLFNRYPLPLKGLNKINLNLTASASEVTGINYNLDKINIDVTLKNGELKIAPAEFVFSEGSIALNVGIDTRRTPEYTLNIKGRSIQLGDLISEIHHPPAIEGNLDLVVDLKSRGSTAHEIASNLNGEFGLILENGKIRKRELELLFLNPLGWLFSYGISSNELKISCGVARYRIKQGTAKSQVLYIDGPKLTARGKGEINLRKETIYALVNLEKKKLLFNTNVPIQIQGNLADPTFSQAPIDSPMLKADRYLFAPATAIPQELLGTLWDFVDKKGNKDHSCQGIITR